VVKQGCQEDRHDPNANPDMASWQEYSTTKFNKAVAFHTGDSARTMQTLMSACAVNEPLDLLSARFQHLDATSDSLAEGLDEHSGPLAICQRHLRQLLVIGKDENVDPRRDRCKERAGTMDPDP